MGTVIFVILFGGRFCYCGGVNEGGRKQRGIVVVGPERVTNFTGYICGLIYVFYYIRLGGK